MPEFVRVKDKETKHEKSIPLSKFEVESDLWQRLDKPAVDTAGAPLADKPHVSLSSSTKSGQQAESTKEKS